EAQVAAAIASVPGSKLFVYEIPREPDDAVRVHLYAPDGTGRIVYVHPETLAILKTVPHAARLTEVVKTIHGELLVGRTGSILVELAASWAVIMLVTGLYLWWPRETRGLGGVLYPRLRAGRRVFWRDLHAVAGLWISALALFLLITALPWTTVWGTGFKELRTLGTPKLEQDWSSGRSAEHAEHLRDMAARTLASPIALDQMVQRAAALKLDPPVRVYLPSDRQPYWRVRSETQNRPRVRELEFGLDGALIRDEGFGSRPLMDRVVGIGVAAHEGQLFGAANQALGLLTAAGLLLLCVSALVMWWRRRPGGSLGIPAPRVAAFRIGWPLGIAIVALGILLPLFGVSVLILCLLPKMGSGPDPRIGV
ncbi:MAG TPA: PepSY domain-containing protein, partial [Steroidobacteraceae bacterium]